MERKEKVGLIAVGFLGILSAVLGFSAEATRIKESDVTITDTDCIYPTNNPASGLALTAAIVLLIARIIIIILTGCSCCRRNPNRSIANCTSATACLVLSWFSFVIAQLIFLGGALIDGQRGHVSEYYYYCSVVKRGQFAIASSLTLTSVILGIAYAYALISVNKNTNSPNVITPNNQTGIAMGQPIQSTVVQDPVFVHEDTYMRRQFT